MNEEYEERLNGLKARYSNLKAKILHCNDFINKCETLTGVTSVTENSDKTQCEIKVAGKEGSVNVALTGSAKGGIKSITSTSSDGNMVYTLCYEDGEEKEHKLEFTLNHGTDKVGKDGSDKYVSYDNDGNVIVAISPLTGLSGKATGFSASVTGASVSATGMSVSVKVAGFSAFAIYDSNAGMSTDMSLAEPVSSVLYGEIQSAIQDTKVVDDDADVVSNESIPVSSETAAVNNEGNVANVEGLGGSLDSQVNGVDVQ